MPRSEKPSLDEKHPALNRSVVFLLLASAAFLYLNLILLPRTPILEGGDQVFFWMDAQHMLSGERIYRDFFQFTPPGADFFYFSLFKVFGPRIWVTNAAILFLGVALTAACFFVAHRVMDRAPAFLAASLFLTLLYCKLLNATHHWFSMLAILAAAFVVLGGRSPSRTAATGALLGVASFFTQTHGAVAAIVVAGWLLCDEFTRSKSLRRSLKPPAVLIASYAVALLALSSYFLATIGPRQLWYFQVTYVRRFMVSGFSQFPGLPESFTWHRLPVVGQYIFVCIILPFVYPLAFVLRRRMCERSRERSPSGINSVALSGSPVALLALLGLGLFLEVALSANWLRLYTIAIPGIILLVWLADAAGPLRRLALALILLAVVTLAGRDVWARQRQPYVVANLPAGEAALAPSTFEEFGVVARVTRPGDFFFQAMWPGVYIPLALRNPVYLDALRTNEQTRPEYVARSVADLESKRVRYILWSQRLNQPDPSHPSADHLGPLLDYLHARYQLIETFSDGGELWQRVP